MIPIEKLKSMPNGVRMMEKKRIQDIERKKICCCYCKHCYDEWSDGTAKCAAADGGIVGNIYEERECKAFKEYE